MNFNDQNRQCFVTPRLAKGLSRWAERCFARRGMTVPTWNGKIHNRRWAAKELIRAPQAPLRPLRFDLSLQCFQATLKLETIFKEWQIHVKRLWPDCLNLGDNRSQYVACQRFRYTR